MATITAQGLRSALCFIAERVQNEEGWLNSLDAAIGDGDHGITMRIGFQAIQSRVSMLPADSDLGVTLGEAGRAFMGATGGAIGVILGKMLASGKVVLRDRVTLGPAEMAEWLRVMGTTVANAGKCKLGDKTILDSVHAAAESASHSLAAGGELIEVTRQAASAAETAAQDTANMICKVGRASRLGERSLGHPDSGAVSFAVILRALSDWMEQSAQRD